MTFLYGTSLAYGIGSGVWIDALAQETDPGIAVIAPAALGAGVPLGLYAWDYFDEFDRGVPSTMATGLLLGGVEGIAIAGLQWQLTSGAPGRAWSFRGETTAAFLGATVGGVSGYAFGEFLQPDPRSLAFISSGAAWGTLAGVLLGGGVVGTSRDIGDGAAVWGFAGYNAGVVATGAISLLYTPSWETLKYMWLGEIVGTAATTPVYLFYINSNNDNLHHGMIANAVGGMAGLAVAAVLTSNFSDGPGSASWTPPFQLGVGPTPHGGALLQAFGAF
jgi:hypothetical protein